MADRESVNRRRSPRDLVLSALRHPQRLLPRLVARRPDAMPESRHEAIARLAAVRDEPIELVVERFAAALQRLPRTLSKHIPSMIGQPIASSGVQDDLAFVELENGRVFWGHISRPRHQREFEFVADLLPSALTPDTYLLAIDVTSRYLGGHSWYPEELLPRRGGTVVEVGAYLGHKSIRFVDDVVGPKGHVLAIEMMPENVEILRRNVAANHLEGVIEVLPVAVGESRSVRMAHSAGRQRNSLVALDKLPGADRVSVRTESLDEILERWAHGVDFIVITANGAESAVLEGLRIHAPRVRNACVVAHYTVDGERTYDRCRDRLVTLGFTVLALSTDQYLYASRVAAEPSTVL